MAKDQVGKLLERFGELYDEMGAVLEELREVAGGGLTIDQKVRQLEEVFDRIWCTRYAPGETKRYVWKRTLDVPAAKRLLRQLTLADLEGRIAAYVASEDRWFKVEKRHDFTTFASNVNKFQSGAGDTFELGGAAPADCKHLPRCRTDAECTTKRRESMRDSAF